MKALTVCQPYAELISRGEKRIENRRWSTDYKGPLAIHAGQSRAWLRTYSPLPEGMVFGAVVAVVRLVACVRLSLVEPWLDFTNQGREQYGWIVGDNHAEGPWLWIIEDARRVQPIPCSGQRRLWEWTPDRPVEFLSSTFQTRQP